MDKELLDSTPIIIADRRSESPILLRQIQLVQLRLLEVFHEICRRLDLRYWLDFGTLLGAVRHDGFIPWDDDLDVSMPREDFKVFVKKVHSLIPPDIFVQTMETDPYYTSYRVELRLRDRNSTMIRKSYDRFHQGIYIDVFPYDRSPCNIALRNIQQRLYKICIVGSRQNIINDTKRLFDERIIRRKILSAVFTVLPESAVERLILNIYRLVSRWGWRPTLAARQDNHCFEESKIFPLSEVSFEGKRFFAPADPAAHLSILYGDWKRIPPPEERVNSHFCTADPFKPYPWPPQAE
jgi:lipopolysaccharide cholinephosphotransferase